MIWKEISTSVDGNDGNSIEFKINGNNDDYNTLIISNEYLETSPNFKSFLNVDLPREELESLREMLDSYLN